MESPLLAVEEPAAPVATTAARRYLTPVGAALALAALAAVFFYPSASAPSAAPNMIAPNLKADQDDEETHAPNALAPVTYRSLAEVAAAVPGAIVGGTNPLVFIGLGDWGRCGSPTNNPVTRATRCTVQRRMVPAMESWAASLKANNPNLFLMSVGDNYYDGPMPVSGNRDSIPLPPSAADLLAADNDPIWDASFRHVYNTPTLRTTPFYNFQGNHDYGGLLASVVNWGARAASQTRPNTDGYDGRWKNGDLNFTLRLPIGDGSAGNCASIIIIDTCPLINTYRATSSQPDFPERDPDRRASTNLPGVFLDQINKFCPSCGGVSTWEQMRWLRDQLVAESNACKVVFVGGHHPIVGSGQHARSLNQGDLKNPLGTPGGGTGGRLSLPSVFAWAGVDAYMNGHDHNMEVAQAAGVGQTLYICTGAGSNIRTNAILVPDSLYLIEDNGFSVHSANTTHTQITLVKYDGSVVYTKVQAVLPKLRDNPAKPRPASSAFGNVPPVNWVDPAF